MNDNLSKANKLKTKTYAHWRCVYLVPDRSKEERAAHSKLTTELKQKLGALKEAAEECRLDWSPEWLVQLVRMSLNCLSRYHHIMRNIVSAERYVDDGAGLYNDSVDSFNSWIVSVHEKLSPFGITIDESSIWLPNDFIAFLDILFCLIAQEVSKQICTQNLLTPGPI